MKKLSGTYKSILLPVLVVALFACAGLNGAKSGGIVYGKEYIVIRPAAQLSEDACDDIKGILPNYDKHLYRIQTYKTGKLKSEKGSLALNNIQGGLGSDVSKEAKSMGFTGCAVAFGDSTTFQNLMPAREDLLRKLKHILEKYNKK